MGACLTSQKIYQSKKQQIKCHICLDTSINKTGSTSSQWIKPKNYKSRCPYCYGEGIVYVPTIDQQLGVKYLSYNSTSCSHCHGIGVIQPS